MKGMKWDGGVYRRFLLLELVKTVLTSTNPA